MNKKEFLDRISYEDKILLSNIYDKIILHNKINKSIYSNEFYPPSIWRGLKKLSDELGCKIDTYGIFHESERRSIAIVSVYDNLDRDDYLIKLMKIKNMSSFNKLEHRDFLGVLMNQGIKREKFGDLIVEDNSCYVPICDDISDFIENNLIKIGKNPCRIEFLDINSDKIPLYKFSEKNIIVTSMRIDSIVSSLCGISRNLSCDMIKKGLVLIDYEKIFEKNVLVELKSIVTIRGYGKFKIQEYLGETLKKRKKVAVKKYI